MSKRPEIAGFTEKNMFITKERTIYILESTRVLRDTQAQIKKKFMDRGASVSVQSKEKAEEGLIWTLVWDHMKSEAPLFVPDSLKSVKDIKN
jgi:hypothetical protein